MNKITRRVLLICIVLLIPIIPFAVIGELPGQRWLSQYDSNAFLFGLTGAILLMSDILLPIPSSIMGSVLGARLGFLPGWMWCWLGLSVGHCIGYLVGRLWPNKLSDETPVTPTLLLLFASRPVPVLAEAVTFYAGAERMRFVHFLVVMIIGNGIYSMVLAANGATLLPDSLLGPGLFIPMALPLISWAIWRIVTSKASLAK